MCYNRGRKFRGWVRFPTGGNDGVLHGAFVGARDPRKRWIRFDSGANGESPDARNEVNMSVPSHTVDGSGRWSTHRIAIYALLVALTIIASYIEIPLFPAAPYLKYDPSGIICLLAGFAFGPAAAAIISVLAWVPHLFTDPYGTIIAVAVSLALSVVAAWIHRGSHTRSRAMLGVLAGSVAALAVAILGNLVITPLYAHMTMAQVAAMIVPILLPFNLLKFAIHGVIIFLIYKPALSLLSR